MMTYQFFFQNLQPLLTVFGVLAVVYVIARTTRFAAEDEIEISDPQGHKRRVKLTADMSSDEQEAAIRDEIRKLPGL